MQVDMARQSCSSSTWSAPTGSDMLCGGIGGYPSATAPRSNSLAAKQLMSSARVAVDDIHRSSGSGVVVMPPRSNPGSGAGADSASGADPSTSACVAPLGVLELSLQRLEDLMRLEVLGAASEGLLRGCWHLGVRLRDHLLGYASVTPLALTPSHAAVITAAAAYTPTLVSLSLSGKVEVSGDALAVLLSVPRLRALALDVHFARVGLDVMSKLRELTQLEVRRVLCLFFCVWGRGGLHCLITQKFYARISYRLCPSNPTQPIPTRSWY